MITPNESLVRVTLTLERVDVDLIDRLAALEGANRSSEFRQLLAQLRPTLRSTIEAFEAASKARDLLTAEAAAGKLAEFQELLPELQRVQNAYMGLVARIEGEAAAATAKQDPRPSNHGGHTPTPPPMPDDSEIGSEQDDSGSEA